MINPDSLKKDDVGKVILRVTLGVLVLFHGVDKMFNGVGFISDMVGPLAYLVYIGEVIAPLFLIAGAYTRIAAAVVGLNMIVAIVLVHMGQLFMLADSGGYALELQFMYLLGSVAVIFLGGGRHGVKGGQVAWN